MKITAYFSDYTDTIEQEQRKAEAVRKETGADRLLGIMSGNYLQNGLPAAEPAKLRAEKAMKAGADMAVEMSLYASLSSIGIYAFAAARILDKLGCVEHLVLETEDATLEQLTEIAFLLIANTKEFQQKVSRYKEEGMLFYEAQAEAIGEEIEDGRRIMSSGYNIFAVECIKSLKIMYSSISCVCIPREEGGQEAITRGSAVSTHRLSEHLEYQLFFSEPHLSDVYGGYEELTERILEHRAEFQDFMQFSRLIAGEEKDLPDVRKYFLRLLCGMTKSTIAIWRMYDFSPYCSVYTKDEQFFKLLETTCKIPLLPHLTGWEEMDRAGVASYLTGRIKGQDMDRSKRELLKLEERAEQLYRLQMKEMET